METEKRIVTFIEKGIETIEGALQVANFLLESRVIPYHFYEKLPDGKPDFTKGKTGAVAAVLVHGIGTLHLPAMTALQNIIPVNGLLSIKGDLAKSMIFSSGMLHKDSWKEVITGTIKDGDMEVTITATREDNGLTLSKSFSINDAKRAGLWITEQQVNGQDGWKFKSSPWWKYQKRMLYYRPLGYLARDLFGDVLNNMYITEEAMDMPKETIEIIETESGAKITIPDKEHSQKRAEKMTSRVADKIKTEGFSPVDVVVLPPTVVNESKPAKESPFIPTKESYEGFNGETKQVGETKINLEGLNTTRLLEIINSDMDMIEAMQMIPGKNTNKKLKGIVEAHQEGELAEYVAGLLPPLKEEPKDDNIQQNKEFEKGNVIEKNTDFFEPEKKETSTNKYDLAIPEFDAEGKREFSVVKQLFNKMMGITPQITTPRYMELAEKLGFLTKYKDKEIFIKEASVDEINLLLDLN